MRVFDEIGDNHQVREYCNNNKCYFRKLYGKYKRKLTRKNTGNANNGEEIERLCNVRINSPETEKLLFTIGK